MARRQRVEINGAAPPVRGLPLRLWAKGRTKGAAQFGTFATARHSLASHRAAKPMRQTRRTFDDEPMRQTRRTFDDEPMRQPRAKPIRKPRLPSNAKANSASSLHIGGKSQFCKVAAPPTATPANRSRLIECCFVVDRFPRAVGVVDGHGAGELFSGWTKGFLIDAPLLIDDEGHHT